MTSHRSVPLLFTASLLLAGCVTQKMAEVPESQAAIAPSSAKAVIIFMRPSTFGGGVQSSVFDITNEPITLVGIVSMHTKVANTTDPGARRFMVVGETAEFMDANLLPGKTYYALIAPHMGWWKARFSLKPVPSSESQQELDADLADTNWMTNTPASLAWARDNMASIESKKNDSLQEWLSSPDKATLNPDDGR